MEKGFLDSGSKKKSGVNKGVSALQDLAAQIKQIDGKLLGKDGKPLRVLRREYGQQHDDPKAVLNPNSGTPTAAHDVGDIHGVNEDVGDYNMRSKPHNPKGEPLKPILKNVKVTADLRPKVSFNTNVESVKQVVHDVEVPTGQVGSNQLHLDYNVISEQPRPNSSDQDATKNGTTINNGSFADINVKAPSSSSSNNNGSIADLFKRHEHNSKKIVKVSHITSFEEINGADVAIPRAAVDEVRAHFSNTLYGYFLGKRVPFPIVEKYVLNTWAKYGVERVIMRNGFYLFKFKTKEGMEQVMENGPWTIRLSPLILNFWKANSKLEKEELLSIPVWVRLQKIPIVAYSEVGLSHITSKLGKPLMLDSYTCDMCLNPWGRSTYARALIEMSADQVFKDSLIVGIPLEDGSGHSMEAISVEYEWKPPHCVDCKTFGHTKGTCPKAVLVPKATKTTDGEDFIKNDDGFTKVKSRKKNKGANFSGIRLNNPKSKVVWQQKKGVDAKSNSMSSGISPDGVGNGNGDLNSDVNTSNQFDVLNAVDDNIAEPETQPKVSDIDKSDGKVNRKEAHEPSNSKSASNGAQKDKIVSSSSKLKKWDYINESDTTDDEALFNSFGASLGGGNQLEDEDFDFYDGYEDQVVDLHGALKEFRDFKLNKSGRR